MKKKHKKIFIWIGIFLTCIILVSLVSLNYVYAEQTIKDELTGYAFKYGRWIFFYYSGPELTLVFGDDEIVFEMSESFMKNNTPYFNGMPIQDFKNNDVVVQYRMNVYGTKVIDNLEL